MRYLLFLFALSAAALDLGAPLPDFLLPGVDGKTHSAGEYADAQVLVLVFTCNHCPTAQAYEDRLVKLDADYRKRGVVMLAISPNDDKAVRLDELGYSDLNDSLADMKIRAAERAWTFPYLYDGETQAFSAALAVRATPHVFIFDKDRKLRYNGRIDDAEVGEVTTHNTRDAIDDLLAGRDVRVPITRTFGCSTKWASKRSGVQAAADKWAALPVSLSLLPVATADAFGPAEPGQMRLVTAWATWCGPCVEEFPDFVLMQRMFQRRSFQVITVSIDNPDAKPAVEAFLKKEQAAKMRNYLFTGKDKDSLAEAVDPEWQGPVPHTVLYGGDGKVLFRNSGGIEDMQVLRRIIADNLGRTYASRKKKK
ncbi:MAG: thiol-disulfide isomerase/thioredoxin [Rhodothermales bacterium]|jgi:thiol-disulfide isomerase/thioredoxin